MLAVQDCKPDSARADVTLSRGLWGFADVERLEWHRRYHLNVDRAA
jgi:hypothetical protein